MQILVDEQLAVEVNAYVVQGEDGDETLVDSIGTFEILSTWEKLATGRRGSRAGRDVNDPEPSTIYVAEAIGNRLEMFDLTPFYDGVMEHSAYRLEDLTDSLPVRVVD